MSKAVRDPVEACNTCGQIHRDNEMCNHIKMHNKPSDLAPKTKPVRQQKMNLAKKLQLDDSTDESEIAIASILPDDVPAPESDRRNVNAPRGPGVFGQVFVNPDRAQATNDSMGLNSNLVGTYLPMDDDEELEIERVVDLKKKKAKIPKKHINKYENAPVAGAAMSDLGGVGRKVPHQSQFEDERVSASAVPVYEIQ